MMPPTSPDIARFGAAIVRDAEEEHADEHTALYKVHVPIKELGAFYEAIYGSQRGIEVRVELDGETPQIMVAVNASVSEADFSTLVARPHPGGEVHRQQVLVLARGAGDGDGGGYPNASPWARRR